MVFKNIKFKHQRLTEVPAPVLSREWFILKQFDSYPQVCYKMGKSIQAHKKPPKNKSLFLLSRENEHQIF